MRKTIILVSLIFILGGCGNYDRSRLDVMMSKEQETETIPESETQSVVVEYVKENITPETEMSDTENDEQMETAEERTARLRSKTPQPIAISPEDAVDVSIQIHKKSHALQIYSGDTLIGEYALGLAQNPVGAKEKEGDNKNPEGEYYVCNRNDKSQYHLALGLSYPNISDANRGYEQGLISESQRDALIAANEKKEQPDWYTALGGEIMIHGKKGEKGSESDWTRGCFAVEDEVMDMIWDYIPIGTKVTITAD